ncbi:MAG: zinc ribbon domain-containing protein [Coriobacteriales bacterium]|nr:zinc ribbon domain-containing protein [Coriobacteriales bacterium]
MPEYAYRCRDCGHEFVVVRSMDESDREQSCPECSGTTRRSWSAPSVASSSTSQPAAPAGGC